MRPKVLIDVKTSRIHSFSRLSPRLNFSKPLLISLPVKKFLIAFFLLGIGAYALFGSVAAPVLNNSLAAETPTEEAQRKSEERAALQKQLADLEAQIKDHEGNIDSLKEQGKSLSGEISSLNSKIEKIKLQIKATTLSLDRLSSDIQSHTVQIGEKEKELDFNKDALTKALQVVYDNQRVSLVEMLMTNPSLADFFQNVNNLIDVQNSLAVTIDKVIAIKNDLVEQKEELEVQRGDAQALQAYQNKQRNEILSAQKEKSNLLTATKGKETAYQKLLKETQKTAAQIRSRIFELLGGGQLTFEQAYEFAKAAERATGVRAAFLLAVLDRESALGQNVGRCNYKTAMHPTRDIPAFLKITEELGIVPDSVQVSCPILSDGAYGGAMGPAQFIPSTWQLYKSKVADVSGHNPPSPWNNADAFIAAGLYLKDAGAATNENHAAARYYCGSSALKRYVCTGVYGKKVVDQAERFQDDIDQLVQDGGGTG